MSAAQLVARLAQEGIDPTLLAEVAEQLFAGELGAKAIEQRRQSDRDRKARSRDVTGQDVTACDRASLDKEIPPRPPKEINPIPCVRLAREGRFHRMPEGWQPTKPLPAELQAKVNQWPPGTLPDEIAALKRWAANADDKNGKGRKLDWDKALWNWLGRRHDEQYSRISARQPGIGSKSLAGAASAFGHPSTWSEERPF